MNIKALNLISTLMIMLLFLTINVSICNAAYFSPVSDDKQNKKVILTLGVIWEGQDILAHNLKALKQIKRKLQWIPIIQFLNPAYFTKPQSNQEYTSKKIQSVINNTDIIGLHLHPWRSLTKNAKVKFRSQPTFWGNQLSEQNKTQEWGHEVPLSIYTEGEIVRMIEHSQHLFAQNQLSSPKVFMAGGWMAAPHVLEAVRKCGILYDASAIAIQITQKRLTHFPLLSWLKNIWGSIKPPFQPFSSQTEKGSIKQIVLNGGIPDYNSSQEIIEHFSRMLNTSENTSRVHFHLAIYQETAWDTLRSLLSTVEQLKSYATDRNIQFLRIDSLQDLFPSKDEVFSIKLSSKD